MKRYNPFNRSYQEPNRVKVEVGTVKLGDSQGGLIVDRFGKSWTDESTGKTMCYAYLAVGFWAEWEEQQANR